MDPSPSKRAYHDHGFTDESEQQTLHPELNSSVAFPRADQVRTERERESGRYLPTKVTSQHVTLPFRTNPTFPVGKLTGWLSGRLVF